MDANVLSEPTKPAPDANAIDWLRRNESEIAIDPVVLGEIGFGIRVLRPGRRRRLLEKWFEEGVRRLHCLAWEADTGLRWAELLGRLRSKGAAIPIKDSLIAASALTHGLAIATRNRSDFVATGLEIVDPFETPTTDPSKSAHST